MRTHRLSRLGLLTQGAALVGLGITQIACAKDAPPPDQLHINAPPEPRNGNPQPTPEATAQPTASPTSTTSANPTPSATATGSAAGLPPRPPNMNARPFKLPPPPEAKP